MGGGGILSLPDLVSHFNQYLYLPFRSPAPPRGGPLFRLCPVECRCLLETASCYFLMVKMSSRTFAKLPRSTVNIVVPTSPCYLNSIQMALLSHIYMTLVQLTHAFSHCSHVAMHSGRCACSPAMLTMTHAITTATLISTTK